MVGKTELGLIHCDRCGGCTAGGSRGERVCACHCVKARE